MKFSKVSKQKKTNYKPNQKDFNHLVGQLKLLKQKKSSLVTKAIIQDRIIKGLDQKELTSLDEFVFQKQLQDFQKSHLQLNQIEEEKNSQISYKSQKDGKKDEDPEDDNLLNKYLFEEDKLSIEYQKTIVK